MAYRSSMEGLDGTKHLERRPQRATLRESLDILILGENKPKHRAGRMGGGGGMAPIHRWKGGRPHPRPSTDTGGPPRPSRRQRVGGGWDVGVGRRCRGVCQVSGSCTHRRSRSHRCVHRPGMCWTPGRSPSRWRLSSRPSPAPETSRERRATPASSNVGVSHGGVRRLWTSECERKSSPKDRSVTSSEQTARSLHHSSVWRGCRWIQARRGASGQQLWGALTFSVSAHM